MTKQEIYDFMAGRDVSASFSDTDHDSEIDFSEFVEVDVEAKRVKAELKSKREGTYLISAAVPAVLDDNGDIVEEAVEAVYYEYTTDEDLVASVESELDVEQLLGEL